MFCGVGTSGIMYVEILGDSTTVGTMVPTPPKRSAEALSRWTLLWVFGWSRIVPQTIPLSLKLDFTRAYEFGIIPRAVRPGW